MTSYNWMRATNHKLAGLLCAAIVVACGSCSEDNPPGGRENQAPQVWLSGGPPEGSETVYRVELFWGGWDEDGNVAYYEYAVTDNDDGTFDPRDTTRTVDENPWHKVLGTDSVFVFSADILVDSLTTDPASRFERSHTFFIRAVDDRGLASPEPAYRSFTAWTLSPRAVITVPARLGNGLTPSPVPPIATYHWVATDFVGSTTEVQDPDSVRWILHPVANNDFVGGLQYIRDHRDSDEWSAWHDYRAHDGSGKQWTTPPTDIGAYVFAVQAKDEAGAVTPVFDLKYNVRRIRVSNGDNNGPLLELLSDFTCPIVTASTSTPLATLDVVGGVDIQWWWRASAGAYGGYIAGYRYGWDIADVSDPGQWEIDFTPFVSETAASAPRVLDPGIHTFNVEVVDNYGWRTRIEVKLNAVPVTMQRSVLFVDDFNPTSPGIVATNGAVPSDAEHDAFWQDVLANVADFSWENDAVQVDRSHPLSLIKMLDYKTVIWDAWGGFNTIDSQRPLLYDVIHHRSENDIASGCLAGDRRWINILSLYMNAGGHVMVCGYQPMTQAIRSSLAQTAYPFIFRYELDGDQDGNYDRQIQSGDAVGEKSFAYRDACLNVLDLSYTGASWLRTQRDNGCGVTSTRTVDPKNDGIRQALPIDPAFPTLDLRPEVADPGRVYAPSVKGWNSEVYNPPYFSSCAVAEIDPPRPCFEPFYGNGCLNTSSAIYNAPIAFWSGRYGAVVPGSGGIAARSAFLGFEPYYFNPTQVEVMMGVILFDEWGLPHV